MLMKRPRYAPPKREWDRGGGDSVVDRHTREYKSSRFDYLIDESCARDPDRRGENVVDVVCSIRRCGDEMAEETPFWDAHAEKFDRAEDRYESKPVIIVVVIIVIKIISSRRRYA